MHKLRGGGGDSGDGGGGVDCIVDVTAGFTIADAAHVVADARGWTVVDVDVDVGGDV